MIVAIVLGRDAGPFHAGAGRQAQPLGDGFIKLVKMMIAPIIFCTIVVGIAAWKT